MLFSSIPFLYYFLPVFLLFYYVAPKKFKNPVLLLASLVFYGWGEPSFVFLMVLSILSGYLFGLGIEKFRGQKGSKVCMILALLVSFGFLAYFKYANFFITNFSAVTGISVPLLKVVLPIGISFYTFQLVSYILDVYWAKVPAQKNFITLATYIVMFPQLIAGPIVRYTDVEKQLNERTITFDKIAYGIRRFALGMGKKILIANVLGEFAAAFHVTDEKSVLFYWGYAIAISLQIYFDFSGYSDMAIGLGSMLGFTFVENFNYPYISVSATEFWRRWHMSLGSWFRDYVYIPLGGSRCSKARHFFNIFVVWMFTGFWHGAEWTFIVWGLYFGILLVLEKTLLLKFFEKYKWIGHVYLLLFVIISFVIFDANGLGAAGAHIASMFGFGGIPFTTGVTVYYLKSYLVMFFLASIGATPLPKLLVEKAMAKPALSKVIQIAAPGVMVLLVFVSTAYLVDGSFNPFLYFRF
ncbi:MAG: MBOAT family protein [Lachnospiraceae bacterium]|nr:MBOAT family protein [Lachnospiraceae bacterium]